jgi:hypothetical protein
MRTIRPPLATGLGRTGVVVVESARSGIATARGAPRSMPMGGGPMGLPVVHGEQVLAQSPLKSRASIVRRP